MDLKSFLKIINDNLKKVGCAFDHNQDLDLILKAYTTQEEVDLVSTWDVKKEGKLRQDELLVKIVLKRDVLKTKIYSYENRI